MVFEKAERLSKLPPYLFAEIDRKKKEVAKKGIDIISLGIGDPDLPTPKHIIERLKKAAEDPKNHKYPDYEGLFEFRKSASDWMKKRFDVSFDPDSEVVSLIGSKEGIAHIPLAFVNPGDYVLVPDPAYPVYNIGTLFAGGISHIMPLKRENNFLPDLKAIPENVLRKTKIMHINYPNNPTSAVADKSFFEEVIKLAKTYKFIVCHDMAYSELFYEEAPMSIFNVEGAREVAIEMHSLSKTYSMTGWRIGFAVGNPSIIEGLGKIKTNVDSGIFQAVQEAGIEALSGDQSCVEEYRKIYKERRDFVVAELSKMGYEVFYPKATFYVWVKTPDNIDSRTFCGKILEETGVVLTPGIGFGEYGEGYFRIALTVNQNRLKEAIERIKGVKF
ncbi:MAG: LL-diaminopimelate aminotransferase [Proteobacteria bacterium]|nr:LL-diaminopimelate aminotransferase [Pseudomonadota bacterium]